MLSVFCSFTFGQIQLFLSNPVASESNNSTVKYQVLCPGWLLQLTWPGGGGGSGGATESRS